MASGSVLALSALLLIATPAIAAPQKATAKTTEHASQIKPGKRQATTKAVAKTSPKSTTKTSATSNTKATTKANSKSTTKKNVTPRLTARSGKTMVVHGPVDGHVIGPEVSTNCVRFVQMNSDFGLTGKGYTWWREAEGRYPRAHEPASGAVMVFKSTSRMTSGHVALVREVVDSRNILIDHSNWSAGRGGRVDLGAKVVDVSAQNDWSEVQVWYGPIQGIGTGVYPVHGFILPKTPAPTQLVQASNSDWSTD